MKTIAKKNYTNPSLEVMLIQNQSALLAGSAYGSVNDRDDNNGDGYEIGG